VHESHDEYGALLKRPVFVRVVPKPTNRSGRTPTKEWFMPNYQSALYDVVIAGGGPVGLFLACELRLADLSVLVLEQAEDPRSPLKRLPFGMRGLSAPTLEAFYRRRLAARPEPRCKGWEKLISL
jgi:NADPH-dependent 2,4-dienoyl-CoA reductase/sulfur reductase-like enzyme